MSFLLMVFPKVAYYRDSGVGGERQRWEAKRRDLCHGYWVSDDTHYVMEYVIIPKSSLELVVRA